jgi:hypothetical protein
MDMDKAKEAVQPALIQVCPKRALKHSALQLYPLLSA